VAGVVVLVSTGGAVAAGVVLAATVDFLDSDSLLTLLPQPSAPSMTVLPAVDATTIHLFDFTPILLGKSWGHAQSQPGSERAVEDEPCPSARPSSPTARANATPVTIARQFRTNAVSAFAAGSVEFGG